MTEPEVVTLGEALVDLVPAGEAAWTFIARPGGAPANVAVALARLGSSVAFIGRVGRDPLGHLVAQALAGAGVDLRALQVDEARHTPVAFVLQTASDLDRFLIYRSETADGALEFNAEAAALVAKARVLHLGTTSLASERSRAATYAALEAARGHDVIVSLDANLRPSAWDAHDHLFAEARSLLPAAHIVKLTLDELRALELTAETILQAGARVVLITEGAAGATASTQAGTIRVPAPDVPLVDATGAGDAFDAAFLHFVLSRADPFGSDIEEGLRAAVYAGALAVQMAGAMESLPTLDELAAALARADMPPAIQR
jgi:fructokinase